MTFPQYFDGNELQVNIVVLPRDHNPLNPIITGEAPAIPDASEAFADASFSFGVQIIQGFGANPLPQPQPLADAQPVGTQAPQNPREIFEAMANHLQILDVNMVNSNAVLTNIPQSRQFEAPRPLNVSVFKHLPKTFLKATGLKAIKSKNAFTDDTYHCAVKAADFYQGFQQTGPAISWGKVFAHILRQPLLARAAGFIYSFQLPVAADTFPEGGFLYIDLAEGSSFSPQFAADDTFIKRYAARIPILRPGEPRQVFAPLLYPVLNVHDGNYDELFIETAIYDDGFAKTVHCHQAPHRDPLIEEAEGAFPLQDAGVQLGWDDLQLLNWYIRQLSIDTSVSGPVKRLDAPIGVNGFVIDVRQQPPAGEDPGEWESLNWVQNRNTFSLSRDPDNPDDVIVLGDFSGDLPYQVYPTQLDGTEQVTGQRQPYWLPMYFANWTGHSMVLPDQDAATIYQTTHPDLNADPDGQPATDKDGNPVSTGTGVTGAAQNQLNQIYQAGPINALLRYGQSYEFRVRMQDISGGVPDISRQPVNQTPSDIGLCRFKRFIAPIQPRILEVEADPGAQPGDEHPVTGVDGPNHLEELTIRRPKLSYPAVVYTGKYSDPIGRLTAQSNLGLSPEAGDAEHRVGLGIADPDVDRIEISVEIATLKLDKLDSLNGKDDYIHLYTTYRYFPAIGDNEDGYEANLNIPIIYRDIQGTDKVLHTGASLNLEQDLGLEADIVQLSELVLPTGRTARLTVRAVCEDKETDSQTEAYYGVVDAAKPSLDVRFGAAFTVLLYQPSADETGLLADTPGVPALQGLYMRPDASTVFDGTWNTLLFGSSGEGQNSNIQQLANRLNLESNGLTLYAPKGKRVVFGCSSRIRHSLAPDGSSITFASKGDLFNHWICCLNYELDRDWMWDAMETEAFWIRRSKKFTHDSDPGETDVKVGVLKMVRTASFESLDGAQRNSTQLVFFDAVEPKRSEENAFPDTIDITYSMEARFKPDHGTSRDDMESIAMTLPITTVPAQVPKVVSAGYALSPYVRDEKYENSESRKRFLWIEFDQPVEDPQDCYFARVLAQAPDQLISNNHPALFLAPEEPALPVDAELLRIITPASSNDLAGLNAMQPMLKSKDSDVHYILPLPPGLHANSDEMFGFFTYEFRVGHFKRPPAEEGGAGESVWTTAQGRFGRRLKMQGIQHPAPALSCMPNRDKEKVWVTAPYAVAVHKGKNVTANPPRTGLWALLYAQVKRVDNQDYRNILLDDRPLDWRVQVQAIVQENLLESYSELELQLLNQVAIKTLKGQGDISSARKFLKLKSGSGKNKNATKYGTTLWSNTEINQFLQLYGLPRDASLSVVVVEVLPQINDLFDHVSGLEDTLVAESTSNFMNSGQRDSFNQSYKQRFGSAAGTTSAPVNLNSPVSNELGHHRILRTSRLTKVPDICCPDCD
ncbi:hypothetical protein SAMN04488057_10463 [Cyclobacterium lianum]|uniref:Uncharacterized protein n=2 Tax=Cyclobacterium lianum TaxID=388280 RepID=A0A1M7M3K9_9BACT|nr:hypothetical protein SAMN04488057_10463 [Cyclobacterium lianum]